MVGIAKKTNSGIRNKKSKNKPMSRNEMVKKMLEDQKIIKNALENGIPLKELQIKHGFKFASLPSVKN